MVEDAELETCERVRRWSRRMISLILIFGFLCQSSIFRYPDDLRNIVQQCASQCSECFSSFWKSCPSSESVFLFFSFRNLFLCFSIVLLVVFPYHLFLCFSNLLFQQLRRHFIRGSRGENLVHLSQGKLFVFICLSSFIICFYLSQGKVGGWANPHQGHLKTKNKGWS